MSIQEVERFTAGERFAVSPDAIERELASAWRAAGRSAAGRQPVTRACLWNVVVLADGRTEAGCRECARLDAMVKDLPRHLAARALVLRPEVGPVREGAPELESYISANCILAGGGGKLVCSEEIALVARGEEGRRHLPALVRALLVPGVPTAVVFGSVPEPEDPLASALVDVADRVVLQVAQSERSDPFRMAPELVAGRPFTDIAWIQQADLRRAVAAVFEGADAEAEALHWVGARARPSDRPAAALALGWVAARLGVQDVVDRAEGRARLRAGRRVIDFVLEGDERAEGLSLTFRTPTGERSVRRDHDGDLRLERPSGSRRRPCAHDGSAALLARALLARSEDPELGAALRWGRELAR